MLLSKFVPYYCLH